jgi:hypothetical protein
MTTTINLDTDTPAVVELPKTITLSELFSYDVPSVRRQVLNSFVSSLNLSIVTRLRDYLADKRKVPHRDTWGYGTNDDEIDPTIDSRNEQDDALGQNAGCYSQGTVDEANAAYAGNPLPPNNFEIAKALCVIRSYIHIQQAMLQQKVIPDFLHGAIRAITPKAEIAFTPRSLNESVDWLIANTPQEVDVTDEAVKLAHAALGGVVKLEQVTALKNAELKTVREMYPQVVALGEELTSFYAPDEQAVEEAFDSLPVIARLNLLLTAANSCTSLINNSLKNLLRRGQVSAAGDITIGRNLHARCVTTLQQLASKNDREVTELYERGGQLKELKTLSLPA